jgi:hypothetical protein
MKKFLVMLLVVVISCMVGCTRNVNYIKQNGEKWLNELDYDVIGYEGYQMNPICGGQVWFMIREKGMINNKRYSCYLTKWNGELHLYGPYQIDKGVVIE